jgi:hypothetical protein
MWTKVARRAELSIIACGCCSYHHGKCGIGVGHGNLPVAWWREFLGTQSVFSIRLMVLAAKTRADFTQAAMASFHVLTQFSNSFVRREAK